MCVSMFYLGVVALDTLKCFRQKRYACMAVLVSHFLLIFLASVISLISFSKSFPNIRSVLWISAEHMAFHSFLNSGSNDIFRLGVILKKI